MDTEKSSETHVPGHDMPHAKADLERLQIAGAVSEDVDALIADMEQQLMASGHNKRGFFNLSFKDPRHFTWVLVAFASMGGMLSGLDQSLISGANLYLPRDLGLSTRMNSLVDSGMPLGGVGGALLLSPVNELFGRKRAIIAALILYTIGAALEASAVNYGQFLDLETPDWRQYKAERRVGSAHES